MDITSFLIGKEVGGGSAPTPTYQDKEITITQNGEQTITADSGYDALSSVEITTNVPQPSGKITITQNGTDIDVSSYATADVNVGGGTTPTDIDEWNTALDNTTLDFLDYCDNLPSSYEPILNEPATLYSPNSDYIYYIITKRKTDNMYTINWLSKNQIALYDLSSGSEGIQVGTFSYYNAFDIVRENGEYVYTSPKYIMNAGYARKYYSNSYSTLNDLIDAIKNNTATYSYAKGEISSNSTIIASNSAVFTGDTQNYTDYAVLKNLQRISANETITS